MGSKKEARQAGKLGRATYQRRYTGSIPREEFERGCAALGAMWMLLWCLMWSVETGLIPCPW